MQVDIPHGLFGVSLIWDFLDFYQHPILSNEYAHDYINITTYTDGVFNGFFMFLVLFLGLLFIYNTNYSIICSTLHFHHNLER